MIRPSRVALVVASLVVVAIMGTGALVLVPGWRWAVPKVLTEDGNTIVRTDDADVPLADDRLADKVPTFDPGLVDRRPVDGWQVNTSGAVIKVDVPMLFDELEADRPLAPSYAALMQQTSWTTLPSVNLIDGKAKQFDDGLYAAIDRAYYAGDPALGSNVMGHRALIERLQARVQPGSAAADYLAAGLSLDQTHPPTAPLSRTARRRVDAFLATPIKSRPIGFYTWEPTLEDCFRVLRYFSEPIVELPVLAEIVRTLRADPDVMARLRAANSLYARLTNPLDHPSLVNLIDNPRLADVPNGAFSLFPPSTSREVELFRQIFPNGPPPNAQMMRALVLAIRSGTVDLAPNAKSGWYEYQAFALEPLLLPERGEGADHLLLTRDYKKRMLVAFEALLTKRRETHARQLAIAVGAMAPVAPVRKVPPIRPRLRVEPSPSYYLRTARAYAFVANLLDATFGIEALGVIHGRTATGLRPEPLGAEVRGMADLFLGLACLSSEDIGHRLTLTEAEADRREPAEAAATAWLDRIKADPQADPDLAADTRVAIPIGFNPDTGKVRLWATIGVSLTPLQASYAQPPQIRPVEGGDWQVVESDDLHSTHESIAVDEFAEVELDNGRVFTRAELRAICDKHQTRDAIRRALGALR